MTQSPVFSIPITDDRSHNLQQGIESDQLLNTEPAWIIFNIWPWCIHKVHNPVIFQTVTCHTKLWALAILYGHQNTVSDLHYFELLDVEPAKSDALSKSSPSSALISLWELLMILSLWDCITWSALSIFSAGFFLLRVQQSISLASNLFLFFLPSDLLTLVWSSGCTLYLLL